LCPRFVAGEGDRAPSKGVESQLSSFEIPKLTHHLVLIPAIAVARSGC
jgi:hypothetical protein